MKKVLSVAMALIMAITCLGFGSLTASADEYSDYLKALKNANSISVGESKSVSLNSQASTYVGTIAVLKFVPTETKWYEFVCDTQPSSGSVYAYVETTSTSDEDIKSGFSTAGIYADTEDFKVGAKLTKGKKYYLILSGEECGKYTTNVKVKSHSHSLDSSYAYSAYYEKYDFDGEEYTMTFDGGKYQDCKYCGYVKTLETYYSPKKVTLSSSSVVYDGSKKTPKVTVKDRKGNTISSSNYTVKYKNNTKPGKATITITFNDKKYSGSMTKTFTIKPKQETISSVKSNKSKKITVSWKKDSNVTGYQIAYSKSSKFPSDSTKKVTVSGYKNNSKTISKLTGGSKYYVKVRSYKTVDGKKIYGAWSKVSSVKVKK